MTRIVQLLDMTQPLTSVLPPRRTGVNFQQETSSRAGTQPMDRRLPPAPAVAPLTYGSGVSNVAPATTTGTSRVCDSNGHKPTP